MNDETNQSDVFPEDAQEKPKRRRTIWMWLILAWAVYSFVSLGIGFVGFFFLDQKLLETAGLAQLGIVYYLMLLIFTAIFLAASLALFYFRTIAIKLFIIAAVGSIFTSFYPMTNAEYFAIQQTTADTMNISPWTFIIGGWIFGFSIYIALILYSLRLKRYGWLTD